MTNVETGRRSVWDAGLKDGLSPKVYFGMAGVTLTDPTFRTDTRRLLNLNHGILGVVSELYEYEQARRSPDIINQYEELGDLMWYCACLVRAVTDKPSDRFFDCLSVKSVRKVANSMRAQAGAPPISLYELAGRVVGQLADLAKRAIYYVPDQAKQFPDGPALRKTILSLVGELWATVDAEVLVVTERVQNRAKKWRIKPPVPSVSPGVVRAANINKLMVRYGGRFDAAAALNRNLRRELQVLDRSLAGPRSVGTDQ